VVTDVLSGVGLAIDPVPWARAQMAFTLAFHIILRSAWSVTRSAGETAVRTAVC